LTGRDTGQVTDCGHSINDLAQAIPEPAIGHVIKFNSAHDEPSTPEQSLRHVPSAQREVVAGHVTWVGHVNKLPCDKHSPDGQRVYPAPQTLSTVETDVHISSEIEHEPSGQVNGLVTGQVTSVGQSKREARQTPDEHEYGIDGGHDNGAGHESTVAAHAPDGHFTGDDGGHVEITGHCDGEPTHVPSAGHAIEPTGHDGGVVHNANDALHDLSLHKTGRSP